VCTQVYWHMDREITSLMLKIHARLNRITGWNRVKIMNKINIRGECEVGGGMSNKLTVM